MFNTKFKIIVLIILIVTLLTACGVDDVETIVEEEIPEKELAPEYLLTDEVITYDDDEFELTTILLEVDGETLSFDPKYNNGDDSEVVIIGFRDRSLVPLRELADKLGYSLMWDGAGRKQVLIIEGNGLTITTKLNSNEYLIKKGGDEDLVLAETPNVKYDRKIYVPVRFIGETFGLDVEWLEEERKVVMKTIKE